MRVADEPNVGVLRQKARILESENERLNEKVSELLREVCTLKGMPAKAVEVNLPGLTAQAAGRPDPSLTRAGSERQADATEKDKKDKKEKKPRRGHGPTEQPELDIVEKTYPVGEDQRGPCSVCGRMLEDWDQADTSDIVKRVPGKWIIERCTREKCRCPNGCTIVTAPGPKKLIDGGRYSFEVAVDSAVEKFLDHIPLERQVRIAKRTGMRITSQTLWNQQDALAKLLAPLCRRIKAHIVTRPVIGADLSPFKLIEKGGSVKRQVWQLSCPDARYFEILGSKEAKVGRDLFEVKDDDGALVHRFRGTAVVDGASELERVAKDVGFLIANCWSHARRNVLEAGGEAPGQVAEFLKLVGKLYAIEASLATEHKGAPGGYRQHLDVKRLAEARDLKSRAVTVELKAWIEAQQCVPGGILKKKLLYVAGRWTGLTRFLDNPLIPLDNNETEGGFIGVAIGRRNYVGCRSRRGMEVAATFYTVFESCRVVGADAAAYMAYAAGELLDGREPLLPHEWVGAAPPPGEDTS